MFRPRRAAIRGLSAISEGLSGSRPVARPAGTTPFRGVLACTGSAPPSASIAVTERVTATAVTLGSVTSLAMSASCGVLHREVGGLPGPHRVVLQRARCPSRKPAPRRSRPRRPPHPPTRGRPARGRAPPGAGRRAPPARGRSTRGRAAGPVPARAWCGARPTAADTPTIARNTTAVAPAPADGHRPRRAEPHLGLEPRLAAQRLEHARRHRQPRREEGRDHGRGRRGAARARPPARRWSAPAPARRSASRGAGA